MLLNNFLLALLQTWRSYQSTHPVHKHEQHRTFPAFHFVRNKFYDRNISHSILLGWMIYQLSLFSDYLRHWWCFEEFHQLAFHQNYSHYSLKSQSAFFDHTYLRSKRKLTITMSHLRMRCLLKVKLDFKKKNQA